MANILKKVFVPNTDQVSQSFTVQSWHVSQSVDAFTGASAYDITISGSLTLTGSVSSKNGFTGSLLGTSSWANNAVTASYALNALSSSFASTASYVKNAQTASYVLNAISASYSSTASYVNPLVQSVILTGSLNTTGSVVLKGLTTQSKSFLVTIDNTTGQLYYTSSAAAISATTPSLPFSSIQYNNGGAFGGVTNLTWDGTTLRGTGSFTGSFVGAFTGNLTGTSSWATNALGANNATNASNATYATSAGNATTATTATNVIGTANCILYNNGTNTTTTSTALQFGPFSNVLTVNGGCIRVTDGVQVIGSAVPGYIYATGDVVAFSTSDKRLKDNIIPIINPIEKIQKIGGYEFDWIPAENIHSYEGHDIGVIAQEIEEVLPELVTTRDNGYKAVKYDKIVALLIEAIKDQQKQIEELKSKLG